MCCAVLVFNKSSRLSADTNYHSLLKVNISIPHTYGTLWSGIIDPHAYIFNKYITYALCSTRKYVFTHRKWYIRAWHTCKDSSWSAYIFVRLTIFRDDDDITFSFPIQWFEVILYICLSQIINFSKYTNWH
jgi:hypothetical protein